MTRDAICKNCAHFSTGWNEFGFCNIQLPPWTNTEYADRQVHAESTCDLHKPKEARDAEIERLLEALKKYGQHRSDCAVVLGGYQCTCGFNQQEQPR